VTPSSLVEDTFTHKM